MEMMSSTFAKLHFVPTSIMGACVTTKSKCTINNNDTKKSTYIINVSQSRMSAGHVIMSRLQFEVIQGKHVLTFRSSEGPADRAGTLQGLGPSNIGTAARQFHSHLKG